MSAGYVYVRSEPGLWTAGHYDPQGKWQPESDHDSEAAAADRVHFLNGGAVVDPYRAEAIAAQAILRGLRDSISTYLDPSRERAKVDEAQQRNASELAQACEPWQHGVGEPPEWGSPLMGVFQAGIGFATKELADMLGVEMYEGGDGTDSIDGDTRAELGNVLNGAGFDLSGFSAGIARNGTGALEFHHAAQAWFQERVREWVESRLGADHQQNVGTRALRLLEEAAEFAQAVGIVREKLEQVLDIVYSRPPGDPAQELGGVAITTASAAASLGVSLSHVACTELLRIESLPAEHFQRRNAEKVHA